MNDPVILNDWHAVASVQEINRDNIKAVRLLEQDIVIWRNGTDFYAMSDRCPHRGTRLSLGKIKSERLVCPYHGWEFNTEGQCTYQPAQPEITPSSRTCIETYLVKQAYGLIWVCLAQPKNDVPEFIGLDDDYHLVVTGPYEVNTSAPRVVENFLDMAHLPFVHAGLLGEEPHTEIKDYDVDITDDGVEVRNFHIWQPNASSVHTEGMKIEYSYNILRPYSIMLTKQPQSQTGKPTDLIFLTVAPQEELQVRAWIIMATTYGNKETEQTVHDFQDKIFLQDKDILESQRPQCLPLDPTIEKHQRADKASVEYRRWLKQLGLSYGTTTNSM